MSGTHGPSDVSSSAASSNIYWLRKRILEDLRAVIGRREEKRSLRTGDPEEAKTLQAEALVDLAAEWAAARATKAAHAGAAAGDDILQPKRLTEREA